VAVTGITYAVFVASGGGSGGGYCAVLETGTVDCWGDNSGGQLGDGSTGGQSGVAVAVSGITNVAALTGGAIGGYCAVLASGGVDCWGNNGNGDLGDVTAGAFSDVPVAVTSVTDATAITNSHGGGGYCAFLSTGTVDCWGDNQMGELGQGSTDAAVGGPVEVAATH
jgi:alpha-tubulin suppressor-like RCC1 family protein